MPTKQKKADIEQEEENVVTDDVMVMNYMEATNKKNCCQYQQILDNFS